MATGVTPLNPPLRRRVRLTMPGLTPPASRGKLGVLGLLALATLLLWVHGCHFGEHEDDDLGLRPRLERRTEE